MGAIGLILVGLGLSMIICLGSGYCIGVMCASVLFCVLFWWILELLQPCEVFQSLEKESNQPWMVGDKR